MQNKHKPPITNIGSVSLIMIFIVLCMVTFAILSLSESTGDYKFTEKLASHTTDYYAASSQAERALAEIDALLHEESEYVISSTENTLGSGENSISPDKNSITSDENVIDSNENIINSDENNVNSDEGDVSSSNIGSEDLASNISSSETLFYQNVIEAINNASITGINDLSAAFDNDEILYISYDVPVGDSQKLYVRLRVNAPQAATSAAYTITAWQTLQTDEWNGDDSIQLIK